MKIGNGSKHSCFKEVKNKNMSSYTKAEMYKGWEIKFSRHYKFYRVSGSVMIFSTVEVAKKIIDLLDKVNPAK